MQLRRIGRYQLLEIVGRGGQGTVYRGHDPSTGQIVAVKILSENHRDGDFLERFQGIGIELVFPAGEVEFLFQPDFQLKLETVL